MKAIISCDTDLFLLNRISDNFYDNCQYQLFQKILYNTLKEAVKNKDFDFEIATLRLYNGGYLLFHAHVFGGATKTKDRVNHLKDAEKIATESLENELKNMNIDSTSAKKIFVLYNEELNDLKRNVSIISSNLDYREIDEKTHIYYGKEMILGTSDKRIIKHPSLDYISFKILERLVEFDIHNRDLLIEITNETVDRFLRYGPILLTYNKKAYKKEIYMSGINSLIMAISLIGFAYYFGSFFQNSLFSFGLILVAFSIAGMSAFTLKNLWTDNDVVYK